MDRPGPVFQMFHRYINNAKSYGELEDKDDGVPDFLPYNTHSFSSSNYELLSRNLILFLLTVVLFGK